MVGMLSRFSGYMNGPHHLQPAVSILHLQDDKKVQVEEDDEREEVIAGDLDSSEGDDHELLVVKGMDGEFKPIEHPMEPPDEDRPAKCPLPHSFLVDDEGDLKESFIQSLRKRVESSTEDEESAAEQSPAQANRKIPRYPVFCPSPRGAQYNIFQVFNQCKSFGAGDI